MLCCYVFFFSSRRRHTRYIGDWSSDVCSSDLGDITHLHIGFKGTMNAIFLKDLAEKTHRGLRGRIEDGKSAGGLCYGYRLVKALSGGNVTTGERDIEPTEAPIVERIFRDFVAGVSPKQIAKNLNRCAGAV